ncbi:MAG: DHA2 family efflux MFS transporter permease subunit [Breznakibacter sp.]
MQRRSLIISLIVGGAFLMENLDSTAITTAIPQMAKDFNVDAVGMSMGVTAYVVMLVVFIPISGWIADRYGTRAVFCSAIGSFLASSVLCGLSTSLPMFVMSRVLQGISGAMMVPVGQLAVLGNTSKKDLVAAIAYITWPGLAGPICGPFLGGFFTTYLSWHWIFFINIPLGILAIILALKYIPNHRGANGRLLDWFGFILSSSGLLCLMVGIELLSKEHVDMSIVTVLIPGALFLLGGSVWHSLKSPHPLIDYSVLKVKTFRVTVLSGTLTKIVINTAPYLLPLFFQIGFGLDAFNAGLLYMSSMIGNLVMKSAAIWIIRRFNFRAILTVNGVLLALAIFLQSYLEPSTPHWLVIALLFAAGLTRSMQFSGLNTLAYADIAPKSMSNANTLYITMQQLAIALGITFGATLLHFSAASHGHGNSYQMEDFRLALQLVALVGLGCVIEFFGIGKHDALNVRHR